MSRPYLLKVALMASLVGRNTVMPEAWSDRMAAHAGKFLLIGASVYTADYYTLPAL